MYDDEYTIPFSASENTLHPTLRNFLGSAGRVHLGTQHTPAKRMDINQAFPVSESTNFGNIDDILPLVHNFFLPDQSDRVVPPSRPVVEKSAEIAKWNGKDESFKFNPGLRRKGDTKTIKILWFCFFFS